VLAGEDEAALVVAPTDPAAAAFALAELGPRHAVVKLGAQGAVAAVRGPSVRAPAVPVRVVDSVGAGDAFVAGYLTAVLDGAPAFECLRTACAVGAFAVTVPGDWEGLPTPEQSSGCSRRPKAPSCADGRACDATSARPARHRRERGTRTSASTELGAVSAPLAAQWQPETIAG